MLPKQISYYLLDQEIGRGGMSVVYLAHQKDSEEKVAVKTLLPEYAEDQSHPQDFLREAKLSLKLNHPHIVKVLEVDSYQNQPYMVMEYVQGNTLDKVIGKDKLTLEQCLDFGIQLTEALDHAHSQGIIHRDIKPSNIILDGDEVKLMDFGLAMQGGEELLSDRSYISGTVQYLSPEQVMGEKADCRSDLFSLGMVLYQLISSRYPFRTDSLSSLLHSILYSEPLDLQELLPELPDEAVKVIYKSLHKKPHRRYQSAEELRTDLKNLMNLLKGIQAELIATA